MEQNSFLTKMIVILLSVLVLEGAFLIFQEYSSQNTDDDNDNIIDSPDEELQSLVNRINAEGAIIYYNTGKGNEILPSSDVVSLVGDMLHIKAHVAGYASYKETWIPISNIAYIQFD